MPDTNADTEWVLEAVIRTPDAATAEWVLRQIVALLADRGDGARLDVAGFFEAEAYDAPQDGDEALLERLLEAGA